MSALSLSRHRVLCLFRHQKSLTVSTCRRPRRSTGLARSSGARRLSGERQSAASQRAAAAASRAAVRGSSRGRRGLARGSDPATGKKKREKMKGTCCSWLQEWGGRNRIGCGSPVVGEEKKGAKRKKKMSSRASFSLFTSSKKKGKKTEEGD